MTALLSFEITLLELSNFVTKSSCISLRVKIIVDFIGVELLAIV
jgi:hypothetical protein